MSAISLMFLLLFQQYNIPFTPRCPDMSSVTVLLNWENEVCTTDITDEYTVDDGVTEKSFDTTGTQVGTGAAISDENALQGVCGTDNVISATKSHFLFENYAGDSTEIPESEGSFGIQVKWTSGEGTNAHLFRCGTTGLNPDHIGFNVTNSDGDVTATWGDGAGNFQITTDGGACDNILGDNAVHVLEMRHDNTTLTLYADNTSCGTDSTGTDPTWGGTEDCATGPIVANETITFDMDLIGVSTSGAFNWYDTWITQGCVKYVAP